MTLAFVLMALAAFLLGVSLLGEQETEGTIALRILGILLAFAALWAWFAG